MDIIKVNDTTAVMALTVEALSKNTFGVLTPYGYKKVSTVDGVSTIIGNLEPPEFIKGLRFNLKRYSLKKKTFSDLARQFKDAYAKHLEHLKPFLESKHRTTTAQHNCKVTTHSMLAGEFYIENGCVVAWVHQERVVLFNGPAYAAYNHDEVIKLPVTVKANEIHLIPWLMNSCISGYMC